VIILLIPTNHNITNDIIAKNGYINLNEMGYLNNNRNKKLTERTHVSLDVFSVGMSITSNKKARFHRLTTT